MSHPTIRDHDVSGLPLGAARHDLLREITTTPVDTARGPRRATRSSWWPAAAATAAVLAVPAYLLSGGGGEDPSRSVPAATAPIGPPSVPGGSYIALGTDWRIASLVTDPPAGGPGALAARPELAEPGYFQVEYVKGAQRLEITQYAAAYRDSYVRDREELGTATTVTVLGRPAAMWAYGPRDHTVIRAAEGSHFAEVRGSGMDLSTYRGLLARLVQTDTPGLASVVPAGVVTPYDRDRAVANLLTGVRTPPGFRTADIALLGFNDRYQATAKVASAVRCAWLGRLDRPGSLRQVLAAFDSSRTWPMLKRIDAQGDYAEDFWTISDRLRAGDSAKALRATHCS